MLHLIFQRHGLPPDEIYNKPASVKKFIYASMLLTLEEEKKADEKRKRESLRGRRK